MNQKPIPKFDTESEEAEWWYEQRDRLGEEAEAALARSELKVRRLLPPALEPDPNKPCILELSYGDASMPPELAPEDQLWRFMDLAKFVSMLHHGALYFCVLDALNDKLEGSFPRVPPGASSWDKKQAGRWWSQNRASLFVNCWYKSSDESAAMWKLYANQGIAVHTTFRLLSRSVDRRPCANPVKPHQMVIGGLVTYDDPDEIPRSEVRPTILVALRKRWWYRYEQEFRLIYHLDSNVSAPRPDSQECTKPKRKGLWVSCDLAQMMTAIVLAPLSPPSLEDAVRAIVEKFGLSASLVRRSRIEEDGPNLQRS